MDQLSLPGFQLLGKIGQGGMATVWKARQLSLDRLVAIKVLSPRLASDPADVERFHAECRSAAMLKHPGIVQVYDATVHNGLYCLIMEYVAGESLGNRIRRKKRMSEDEVLFVLEHVAHALGHAWKTTGLIHCDIKPDNILIDSDGSVKVTDLGLATTLEGMSSMAQTEEIMGTPQYMSPEQISGTGPLDARTDIYSMGATIYQMLTGKMLFDGSADDAVLDLQLKGQVPDAMDVQPSVSSRIAWMTEKMLARNREHRHADWTAVSADIDRLMRGGFPAPPFPKAGESVMKRSSRRQKPRQPAPPPTSPAVSRASSGVGEMILRTLLLLALLAALGAVVFHLFKPRDPLPPPASSAPVSVAPPAAPPPAPPAVSDVDKRFSEMYEHAREWWKNNPQRYEEAIELFDRVARETKGSKFSLMAVEATRSVRQSREAAIQGILARLKETAGALGGSNRFTEAATVYDSYTGALEEETRRERQAAARKWREAGARHAQAAEERTQAARSGLESLFSEAADLAAHGRLPECAERLREGLQREDLKPVQAELAPVAELVQKAATMDQRVAASVEKQKGQEITLQLLSGPRTLVVTEVTNNLVYGDQKVLVGEGVSAASIKIRFSLDELSPRERIQRMGGENDPDVALWRGAAAARAHALAEARNHFQKVPGDFGARLLAGLATIEGESAAPPAPAAVETAPAAAEADAVMPGDLTTLLVEVNPGLQESEIECATNESGRIVRLTCQSRFLTNLEPLKRVASSLEELGIANNQANTPAPITALPKLRRLDLSGSAIADLAPLRDLKLEYLGLSNTRIKDIGPLRSMPTLKELELANTRVISFDALRGLPLTRLNLCNTTFADFSYLRDMPLRELDISGTKVFDFISVRRFQLNVFRAADTPFKDCSLLDGMPITDLNLANTKINDLSPLRRLPLRSLSISGTTIKDLAPLRDLRLTVIRFDTCKIRDLSPLSAMPLEILSCNGSLVEDLAPLKGMGLKTLEAANTGIADLEPLEDMPLEKVIISFTKVTSLRPLGRSPLRELRCEGIRPDSLMTLRAAPLEVLYCDLRPNQLGPNFFQNFPLLKDFNGNPWVRRNPNF